MQLTVLCVNVLTRSNEFIICSHYVHERWTSNTEKNARRLCYLNLWMQRNIASCPNATLKTPGDPKILSYNAKTYPKLGGDGGLELMQTPAKSLQHSSYCTLVCSALCTVPLLIFLPGT